MGLAGDGAANFGRPAGADQARLEADVKLRDVLASEGFAGPRYDQFIDRLARYALAVVRGWLHTGLIFKRCRQRNEMIKLIPPNQWSAEDRDDLASATVAVALQRFHRFALHGGQWSPQGGATFDTYLVGICLDVFPNEFRRWLRQDRRLSVVDPCDPVEVPLPPAWDPLDIILTAEELHNCLTCLSPTQRETLLLHAEGYTARQIAAVLDVTEEAVAARVYRARRKLGLGDEGPVTQ